MEFGASHRFKRHHRDGVQEAEMLFGERGKRAAIVHILRDCRNIPRRKDYEDGTVDKLGLIANWPVTAYIRYPDDAFERLVMYSLNGPEAVLDLGFIGSQDDLLRLFATQALIAENSQQAEILERWPSCVAAKNLLPPLGDAIVKPLTDQQQAYVDEISQHPLMHSIREQFPKITFQQVDVSSLINPLVWIDLEYVEELRAELMGTEDTETVRFAFPTQLTVNTRIAVDADGRGVSVISQQKQVTVTPPIVGQLPGVGMTITFNVIAMPQLILVSRVNGRLYLKNGMHRAYLLASVGVRNIPALIVDETAVPSMATVQPTFNAEVLETERPPVLSDMFEPNLTAKLQIVRTKKVARIRVDETILPID